MLLGAEPMRGTHCIGCRKVVGKVHNSAEIEVVLLLQLQEEVLVVPYSGHEVGTVRQLHWS